MADSETTGKKKSFWTVNNVTGLIGILGFILAFTIAVTPFLFPVRAKLTIFIDHFEYDFTSESNSFGFTVFLKIVNDSPKSANVFYWNVSFNIKVPYQIESQTANRNPPLVLTSSAEADLSMSRTLIGENNTPLPNSDLRSIVVTVQYEDDVGVQEASRSYEFPYN